MADRENNRIQIFDYGGKYLDQWTDTLGPTTLFTDPENTLYVPELSLLCKDYKPVPPTMTIRPRVSIYNSDRRLVARWPRYLSGEQRSDAPGNFIAPHCVWCDSHGDLYVGECFEGSRIQKFVRRD